MEIIRIIGDNHVCCECFATAVTRIDIGKDEKLMHIYLCLTHSLAFASTLYNHVVSITRPVHG
jgi:hypothetical protein